FVDDLAVAADDRCLDGCPILQQGGGSAAYRTQVILLQCFLEQARVGGGDIAGKLIQTPRFGGYQGALPLYADLGARIPVFEVFEEKKCGSDARSRSKRDQKQPGS